jgi:hypothetical protein
MSKSVSNWRITRIRGNRAEQLGLVKATSAEAAIKQAFKVFEIADPQDQKRIAAIQDA